jgi:hypothetical protein
MTLLKRPVDSKMPHYPPKNDKTHVHYHALRTLLPLFVFLAIDIPEFVFPDYIQQTYLSDIHVIGQPNEYVITVLHSLVTCLLGSSPIITRSILRKFPHERPPHPSRIQFEQGLSSFRQHSSYQILFVGSSHDIVVSTRLLTLSKSLPLRVPLASHTTCAFTHDYAVCRQSSEVITLSLAQPNKTIHSYYLDHPSVLSLSAFPFSSFNYKRDPLFIKNTFPDHLAPAATAFYSAWPAISCSNSDISASAITFSRFNLRDRVYLSETSRLPLTTFSMALSVAFPPYTHSHFTDNVKIDVLKYSQVSFVPIIQRHDDDIFFVIMTTNVTALAHDLKRLLRRSYYTPDNHTFPKAAYNLMTLPNELLERVLLHCCLIYPQTCTCYDPNDIMKDPHFSRLTSDFTLTPIRQIERPNNLGELCLTHLMHFNARTMSHSVPPLPTYVQQYESHLTVDFRCNCHFKYWPPDNYEPQSVSAPHFARRFLSEHHQFDDTFRPTEKICNCNHNSGRF